MGRRLEPKPPGLHGPGSLALHPPGDRHKMRPRPPDPSSSACCLFLGPKGQLSPFGDLINVTPLCCSATRSHQGLQNTSWHFLLWRSASETCRCEPGLQPRQEAVHFNVLLFPLQPPAAPPRAACPLTHTHTHTHTQSSASV